MLVSVIMKYRFQRTLLHLRCLFRNPRGWKFYLAGVNRECKEILIELFKKRSAL